MCELDCNDQFNKMKPAWVKSHMGEASEWLGKQKKMVIIGSDMEYQAGTQKR